MAINKPRFTVLFNIVTPNSPWIGTGWQFFDDKKDAETMYECLISLGHCPTLRPYHEGCDRQHLGAAHRMMIKKDHHAKI